MRKSDELNKSIVLGKALNNAADLLGLTHKDIEKIIGVPPFLPDKTIDPVSQEGLLSIYLIRVYEGLHSLVGDDKEDVMLWMSGFNDGTGGVPTEQVKNIDGLIKVMEYVVAMQHR